MNVTDVNNSNWGASLKEFGGIVESMHDYKQSIHIVLTTIPGSVPGDPEFGCGIWNYVDRSRKAIDQLVKLIADALEKYVPQITVTQISYKFEDFNSGKAGVRFSITWKTAMKNNAAVYLQMTSSASDSDAENDGFQYFLDFPLAA